MLPALVFLPIADILEAFQDLLEVFPTDASLVEDYFEDVYIGRPRRNGLFSATSPPLVWSVRESILAEMPRTNNSIEAWHRGLQQSNVGRSSPNIWAFLGCIRREQSLTEMKLAQAEGGTTSSSVSKNYADCNRRLQIILHKSMLIQNLFFGKRSCVDKERLYTREQRFYRKLRQMSHNAAFSSRQLLKLYNVISAWGPFNFLLDSFGFFRENIYQERRCVIVDPNVTEASLRVHWLPTYVNDEEVSAVFRSFGRIKDIRREMWRAPGGEYEIETSTRIVTLSLRDGLTRDELRTRQVDHMGRQCKAPWYRLCREVGHTEDDCAPTYASRARGRVTTPANIRLVDYDEAEETNEQNPKAVTAAMAAEPTVASEAVVGPGAVAEKSEPHVRDKSEAGEQGKPDTPKADASEDTATPTQSATEATASPAGAAAPVVSSKLGPTPKTCSRETRVPIRQSSRQQRTKDE
ncbi:hypothetical protein HPB47_014109 [Ixodes persulcatus]|uniref:Uncharacterized protein n=1 Tax=Ixodes persulcatus TaxID=34615 RepID=A0AC60QZA1_IXOPE|nr:hypothetical protein HPB47_014109 [Ixodes persulcatus]